MEKAVTVSKVSIAANVLLAVIKFVAGILAHSGAMISDAVHSLSDVFSSVVVIIGIKMASREADDTHPYGHERMEPVAAVLLSVVLCLTGLFIGWGALDKIISHSFEEMSMPGQIALIAAGVSIAVKEAMFWYTRHYAKVLDSSALKADAWHHRSDALSSVGALIGIGGARMGYLWLDPVASMIICVFIVKAAYDIFVDAINKLVDKAASQELEEAIEDLANKQPGVIGVSKLQSREFGNKIYVDIEILADGSITLMDSNRISENVHKSIENKFTRIKHIMVRVKPVID